MSVMAALVMFLFLGTMMGIGKTDIAVYHSASGLWFIKPSSGATDYYVGYGGR